MNLASAWLLNEGHEHEHDHDHDNDRDAHRHHDHNLRAAYLHVLADAVASLLAIAALLSGRFFGWTWMDPVMGIVGALAIAHWSLRLMRSSGAVLLDTVIDPRLAARIRIKLEIGSDRISDLHLWRVGRAMLRSSRRSSATIRSPRTITRLASRVSRACLTSPSRSTPVRLASAQVKSHVRLELELAHELVLVGPDRPRGILGVRQA